jgi:hypothetical protein
LKIPAADDYLPQTTDFLDFSVVCGTIGNDEAPDGESDASGEILSLLPEIKKNRSREALGEKTTGMNKDEQLLYADHIGRFYSRQFGFSPMAGRLLGYLAVCVPEKQSIVELAETLMASRSAIAGAIQMLEPFQLITRTRTAGQRSDSISINPAGVERKGFDATVYQEQAALFREGLKLLHGEAHDHRVVMLEEAAAFAEFLAERMPALQQEWHIQRDALRRRKETGSESVQKEPGHAKEEGE